MYTNPILLNVKIQKESEYSEILNSILPLVNSRKSTNKTIYRLHIDPGKSSRFFIVEHYENQTDDHKNDQTEMCYINFSTIKGGIEVEIFTIGAASTPAREITLDIVIFILRNYQTIEPITDIEYSFLTWVDPEKLSQYKVKNPDLKTDPESIEEYKRKAGIMIQSGFPEEKPWEKIPDHKWDRLAVKYWNKGWTCKEIGEKLGVSSKRVMNRLSELRKNHPEEIVPKLPTLRNRNKNIND